MRADRMDALLEATQRDLYWLPAHVQRVEEGALLVLHDGGDDLLHNQVVATPVDVAAGLYALIARVQSLHPGGSRWRVAPTGPMEALQQALPRAGYAPGFRGDAFSVDTAAQWSEADVRVERVVDARGMRDNLDVAGEGFGRPIRPDDVSDQLAMCAAPDAPTARFVAYGPEG